jgi:hypothetical protein
MADSPIGGFVFRRAFFHLLLCVLDHTSSVVDLISHTVFHLFIAVLLLSE